MNSSMSLAEVSSEMVPPSMSRMWSRDWRVSLISSGVTGAVPLRTVSKALSTSWVKDEIASKPNIPEDPLMVCMMRNTAEIISLSVGFSSNERR